MTSDILVLNWHLSITNLLCLVTNMPVTTTNRCSVWTGHADSGKDTLILNKDYNYSSLPCCAVILKYR